MNIEYEEPYDRFRHSRLLEELETVFQLAQLCRKAESDNTFKVIFFFIEQLCFLELAVTDDDRYVSKRTYRTRQEKREDFVKEVLDTSPGARYNSHEFRVLFCMSRGAFYQLWAVICDHPLFKTQKRGQGINSKYQLLVLLKFLGTEGDGMSNSKATAVFPSSSGSIDDIKERVITAIIGNLGYIYCWPKDEERKEIANIIENKYFINDCVGIADGTLLPLGFRPQRNDAANFHGRKLAYTITMLIICDHKKRIRYYHAGWPGNVHDERVF